MDESKAIELLRQGLTEIPSPKELHYDNQKFKLWCNRVETIIKNGLDDDDYNTFSSVQDEYFLDDIVPKDLKQSVHYSKKLKDYETALKLIIQKYELLRVEEKPAAMAGQPLKVFIAHGGDSPALRNLKSFLEALGVQPLVVEEQPSEGRSVSENVDYYARQVDFAIILATKGDIDGKTGSFIPRGNVLMETGKLQEILKDKIIYLLQAGTKFPTNISEKVRERFTPQSMDRAFIKVAKELRNWGFIKAQKEE